MPVEIADFVVSVGLGDDRAPVVFAARGGEGEHGDERKRLFCGDFARDEIPRLPVVTRGGADRLGTVEHAAAAHREDDFDAFFLAHLRALLHALQFGVGFDARKFVDLETVQQFFHLVVQSDLSDTAAAVSEQYFFAVSGEPCGQFFHLSFAEQHARRRAILKIFHNNSLLIEFIFRKRDRGRSRSPS